MLLPYYQDGSSTLHHGDCLEVLRPMDADSADAVVTDPPYGLEFMGKEFDKLGESKAQQLYHSNAR
jgi:DNA modification methylase